MSTELLARLPDPNTNPQGPGFASQQLMDNSPGMVHPLNNGGTIGVKFSGNYWTIDIGYPTLTIEEATPLMSFIYSLGGTFSNFTVQLPTLANPKTGAWGATALTASDVFQTTNMDSNQLGINNWHNRGLGNELNVGDLICLSNHSKVYMIVGTSLENSGTRMILKLNCDVVSKEAVAAAALVTNDIVFKVRLKSSTPPTFTLTPDGLYGSITLSVKENTI